MNRRSFFTRAAAAALALLVAPAAFLAARAKPEGVGSTRWFTPPRGFEKSSGMSKPLSYPAIWTEDDIKRANITCDFADSSIMNKKLSPNSD